jgi:hypothetical protein
VLKGHCLHFADVFEGTAGASTMWFFRQFADAGGFEEATGSESVL